MSKKVGEDFLHTKNLFDSKPHSVDIPASKVIERIASQQSYAIFSYDLAEDVGFGLWTKQWAILEPGAVKVISLQTRAGAGTTLVGRLSEGTSREVRKGLALTAYTTPIGLAQMAPALAILPKPEDSTQLVIQVAGITPVGPNLVFSPTLSPISGTLYSLPDSFTVLMSSTPQESVELASAAYRLTHKHVVHVFDYYDSAREVTDIMLPLQSYTPASSVNEALSDLGYSFFDYAGDSEAKTIVTLLNGPLATAAKTLATQIPGLGVVVVRVLRPWDEKAFQAALPATVETVHVLDEVPSEAAQGGLFLDVFSTLFDPTSAYHPAIQTHRHTPEKTQQYLISPETFTSFFLDLLPSAFVTPTPTLAVASSLKKLLFFSTSNYGFTGLPSFITRVFMSHCGIKTRHLFTHDAFSKPGGVAVDRVLLSAKSDVDDHVPISFLLPLNPCVSEEAEGMADFVGILDPSLLKTHSVLEHARRGAPVLISTSWSPEEFLSNVSSKALSRIHDHNLRVYILNIKGIAAELLAVLSNTTLEDLESILGHLAFLRLYVGKGGHDGDKVVREIARASFGNMIKGMDLNFICTKALDGLQYFSFSRTELIGNDSEAKVTVLKKFEFNTLDPEDDRVHPDVDLPKVSIWHDAAKHIIFGEAFSPPSLLSTEICPQDPALRPDLTEHTYLVTTTVNRRLTPSEYDRNVFHLEFDTKGTGLKYAIGEALGIHGWNNTEEVLDFCKWYGLDPDQLVTIPVPGRGNGEHKVMHTRTVFQALQQQIDIFGRPPKSFYASLSNYAQLRTDQMALYFISSAEGSSTFKKLAEKDTVTFADILKVYKSARPSIAELCELVGDIVPRHYSIASSQAAVGDRVDLLVVTVDWVTPSGSPRYGQCTRYLANLKVGQKVTVSIKPSVMKLPSDPMQPIIMAGLGTGAAPFRAFMQHRAWLSAQQIPVGPLIYYFGSRHRSQEYLYGEEIEAYIADNVITHAGLAFSRDGKTKVYIQHKMKDDAEMLVKHLSAENGVFYLCGPTWPVPDVYEALVHALVKYVGKTTNEAADYLEALKEEERYVLEVY